MKSAPFAYRRPDNIAEALDVLAEFGEDCRVLAGGQSLGAMLNMRLVTPRVILDINRLSELERFSASGSAIVIGATVRQADAMTAKDAQTASLLTAALPHVGHYQTRNRGTICGSVAHADPSAELPLALLVSGGEIELRSRRKTRRVRAEDFFVSTLTTTRGADELVTALHWPKKPPRSGEAFAEFATRSGDYAIVAAACQTTLQADGAIAQIRLGFAGVHERPVLVDTKACNGQRPDNRVVEQLATDAMRDIEPTGDFHATAAFRRNLVGGLARQVITQAFDAARRGEKNV